MSGEEVTITSSCCPEAMMGSMMGIMLNRRDDQQRTNERLDNLENKLDEIFKYVKQKN